MTESRTPAHAAVASQLTRYPYLTDVVQTYATVNFATDTSGASATVKYGRVGQDSCTAKSLSAAKTTITVKGQSEYQWKAKLTGLQTNTLYCYRIYLGSTDLLGDVASPQFWSQIPSGNAQPFSFAVFGDWGDTDLNGDNPYQTAIMQGIANSGVRFALTTGDTAYDSGTQSNYGDLVHTGYRVSSIFGPDYWTQAGDTVPLFNAVGNHGMNATFFTNWPQDRAVSTSSGKYVMETYCCANGATSQKAPSSWYAFNAGNVRFYMLTTAWGTSNVGTTDEYGMDYAYRWQKTSPEYQWLKNDLATHTSQLKMAFFHYPLYGDNATETADPYLLGTDSLEGLLTKYGVNIAFSGHAHMYERNVPTADGLVTYVTGGGGATPEPISHCKSYDAYGIGWSSSGGSKCGTATKPTSIAQVYHFLKVDVNGYAVTVTPYNALGQVFDQMTYDFAPDTTSPTAPANLTASAPAGNRVKLGWDASSDATGVAAYDIYRTDVTSGPIVSVDGTTTSYTDSTASPSTQYSYYVTARDLSNNTSDASNTATVTTPPLDTQAPSSPSNLVAAANTPTKVDLVWTVGTDNVGVASYDIYRDGSQIASVDGNTAAYSDTLVSPATQYSYTVRSLDAAGNASGDSDTATVTTPSNGVLFADDFESSSLGAWSTVSGLIVAQGYPAPNIGTYVAREFASGGGATFAYKSVSTTTDMYAEFRFKVNSRSGSVDLMRFRNGSGGGKLSLLVDGITGKLSTRNAAGTTRKSNVVINTGQWYTVEVHGKIASPSVTEVWLNGTLLPELGATGDLGTTNFGQFLLGQTGTTGTYDVVFDDVVVSKNQI